MRDITLNLAMKDSAAFFLLVSGAATDLALRLDSKDSPEAIGYRAKGMTMVNRRMMIPSQTTSDGAITACVVLSGLEVSETIIRFSFCSDHQQLTQSL